jgi:sensor histidine kinase YesM
MPSFVPQSLTTGQKVRLALSVLVIYWPVRLYQNVSGWTPDLLTQKLPYLVVEGVLSCCFLMGWVYLIDLLHQRLMSRFGRERTGELRTSAQLLLLLTASGMAVLFNIGFHSVYLRMDYKLARQFPTLDQAQERPQHSDEHDFGLRKRMNNGLVFMALLSAFYLTTNRRSIRRIEQLQLDAERMEKEAVQAQFDALKNQINPHFLFNSLSILSSLVDTDTRLAGQFINRLSKAYRYILEQRDNERVSLQTELDFIAAYTFLLMLRFEDKLFVDIDVPPDARDHYAIAPLTLQLLVENAVKHNLLSEEEPLRVSIALAGDYLRVANLIQPRPDREASTGIGLQNITNRYKLLTDKPVWIGEEAGEFIVKLPLLRSERVN